MPFDTLSDRLQFIAQNSLTFCRDRYGGNGLKIEEGIHQSVGWRPTFYLKPSKFQIVAVEVEDNLYPEVLKGAAHDINHYDFPISVYQACSLEAYQTDPKHIKVNQLRSHGFGLITVDDDANVTVQHRCIPLAQHIPADEFDKKISPLSPKIKVAFRGAHETYLTREGQGLQEAGQIVEAMVASIVACAVKDDVVARSTLGEPLAEQIDRLYAKPVFKPHRAALGRARGFIKDYRNTVSHAPKNAKQAAGKIRACKSGFLEAINVCVKLRDVAQVLSYRMTVYLP